MRDEAQLEEMPDGSSQAGSKATRSHRGAQQGGVGSRMSHQVQGPDFRNQGVGQVKGQGSTGCSLVLMGPVEQVRQVAGVAATSPTAHRGPTGPKGTVWTLRQVSCSTEILGAFCLGRGAASASEAGGYHTSCPL